MDSAPRSVQLTDVLRRNARWIVLPVLFVAFVAASVFGYYYTIVTGKFNGRRWDLPSRIYSDVFTLEPGMPLGAASLAARLQRRGYRAVTGEPGKPGEYAVGKAVGKGKEVEAHIFLRDFAYGEKSFKGFPVTVRFEKGAIAALTRSDTIEELPSVDLEPELLSSMYGEAMEDRTLVRLADVPQTLVDAILVTEDENFYRHSGVSLRGLARVVVVRLRGRSTRMQGASTLTQQLVKNLYLNPQRTFKRKAVEAIMAMVLEARYGKDEILEAYLNEIYLGQNGPVNLTGVQEAAEHYFGKHVGRMTLAESAQLAAMIRSPNHYHPSRNPKDVTTRRDIVLGQLRKHRYVEEAAYREALAQPVHPPLGQKRAPGSTAYFADLVRRQIAESYAQEVLQSEGYHIFTTLDLDMQDAAERAVREGLAELEKTYPRLRRKDGPRLQAALIAMEPHTGYVRALIGGRDYQASQFNRVFQAKRQPGSLFKPFIYLTALQSFRRGKVITAATVVSDTSISLVSGKNRWQPVNYDGKFIGNVTVRDSLQGSRNIPTIRLALDVGLDDVIATARRDGIQSPIDKYPSMALGAFEVTPLELAYAYAVFANGGVRAQAESVLEVVDNSGAVLEAKDVRIERAEPSDSVYLLNSILQGVIDKGTGARVRGMGYKRVVAGKTGTTNNFRDAWFVGYSPRFLCLVWVGFDDATNVGLQGSQAALPIWVNFMKAVADRIPDEQFVPPPNIIAREIDPQSGDPATPYCPRKRSEQFIAGTEPIGICRLHNEATWQYEQEGMYTGDPSDPAYDPTYDRGDPGFRLDRNSRERDEEEEEDEEEEDEDEDDEEWRSRNRPKHPPVYIP